MEGGSYFRSFGDCKDPFSGEKTYEGRKKTGPGGIHSFETNSTITRTTIIKERRREGGRKNSLSQTEAKREVENSHQEEKLQRKIKETLKANSELLLAIKLKKRELRELKKQEAWVLRGEDIQEEECLEDSIDNERLSMTSGLSDPSQLNACVGEDLPDLPEEPLCVWKERMDDCNRREAELNAFIEQGQRECQEVDEQLELLKKAEEELEIKSEMLKVIVQRMEEVKKRVMTCLALQSFISQINRWKKPRTSLFFKVVSSRMHEERPHKLIISMFKNAFHGKIQECFSTMRSKLTKEIVEETVNERPLNKKLWDAFQKRRIFAKWRNEARRRLILQKKKIKGLKLFASVARNTMFRFFYKFLGNVRHTKFLQNYLEKNSTIGSRSLNQPKFKFYFANRRIELLSKALYAWSLSRVESGKPKGDSSIQPGVVFSIPGSRTNSPRRDFKRSDSKLRVSCLSSGKKAYSRQVSIDVPRKTKPLEKNNCFQSKNQPILLPLITKLSAARVLVKMNGQIFSKNRRENQQEAFNLIQLASLKELETRHKEAVEFMCDSYEAHREVLCKEVFLCRRYEAGLILSHLVGRKIQNGLHRIYKRAAAQSKQILYHRQQCLLKIHQLFESKTEALKMKALNLLVGLAKSKASEEILKLSRRSTGTKESVLAQQIQLNRSEDRLKYARIEVLSTLLGGLFKNQTARAFNKLKTKSQIKPLFGLGFLRLKITDRILQANLKSSFQLIKTKRSIQKVGLIAKNVQKAGRSLFLKVLAKNVESYRRRLMLSWSKLEILSLKLKRDNLAGSLASIGSFGRFSLSLHRKEVVEQKMALERRLKESQNLTVQLETQMTIAQEKTKKKYIRRLIEIEQTRVTGDSLRGSHKELIRFGLEELRKFAREMKKEEAKPRLEIDKKKILPKVLRKILFGVYTECFRNIVGTKLIERVYDLEEKRDEVYMNLNEMRKQIAIDEESYEQALTSFQTYKDSLESKVEIHSSLVKKLAGYIYHFKLQQKNGAFFYWLKNQASRNRLLRAPTSSDSTVNVHWKKVLLRKALKLLKLNSSRGSREHSLKKRVILMARLKRIFEAKIAHQVDLAFQIITSGSWEKTLRGLAREVCLAKHNWETQQKERAFQRSSSLSTSRPQSSRSRACSRESKKIYWDIDIGAERRFVSSRTQDSLTEVKRWFFPWRVVAKSRNKYRRLIVAFRKKSERNYLRLLFRTFHKCCVKPRVHSMPGLEYNSANYLPGEPRKELYQRALFNRLILSFQGKQIKAFSTFKSFSEEKRTRKHLIILNGLHRIMKRAERQHLEDSLKAMNTKERNYRFSRVLELQQRNQTKMIARTFLDVLSKTVSVKKSLIPLKASIRQTSLLNDGERLWLKKSFNLWKEGILKRKRVKASLSGLGRAWRTWRDVAQEPLSGVYYQDPNHPKYEWTEYDTLLRTKKDLQEDYTEARELLKEATHFQRVGELKIRESKRTINNTLTLVIETSTRTMFDVLNSIVKYRKKLAFHKIRSFSNSASAYNKRLIASLVRSLLEARKSTARMKGQLEGYTEDCRDLVLKKNLIQGLIRENMEIGDRVKVINRGLLEGKDRLADLTEKMYEAVEKKNSLIDIINQKNQEFQFN